MNKLFLASLATFAAASAEAATLYSNNFDGAVVIDPGVVAAGPTNGGLEAASSGAWNASGWSGNYFVNRSTGNPAATSVLTLTNLAPHTTVDINFLLGFLESWDSSNGGCCTPDYLDIFIDGSPVLTGLTTNNALGTFKNYGGGTEIFYRQQVNGNGYFSDTIADMSGAPALSFAHTASTLTFGIRAYGGGWQGGGDEGWGIDKLLITYDGVRTAIPEPDTWMMMILGFGLAGAALRQRRSLSFA